MVARGGLEPTASALKGQRVCHFTNGPYAPGVFDRAQHLGTELLTLQSSNDLSIVHLLSLRSQTEHLWYSPSIAITCRSCNRRRNEPDYNQ